MTASAIRTDSELNNLIDELTAKLQAGEPIDLDAVVAEHPEHADTLRRLVPALQVLADLSRSSEPEAIATGVPSSDLNGALGDFRLIREIGRGGMGIVYEAEQISLNRNVALKVLPFAATMDPRHLQRFRNEAQAAACLHHPNIVPVHGVGCDRGVHYYAMQLIEGQTLAQIIDDCRLSIDELKNPSPGPSPKRRGEEAPSPPSPLPQSRERGEKPSTPQPLPEAERGPRVLPSPGFAGEGPGVRAASGGEGPGVRGYRSTAPNALLSTKRDRAHFRHIATLIASAADALEYAHSMGVVHRDIKPGNILLDSFSPLPASGRGAGGEGAHLWITDFGLAKLANPAREGGGDLTLTGDLIGTLRYMSPEQALAKHGLVDHRTDIYSLGATLYELLTLQPAVAGADKAEILKAIAWDEPTPLRKHDKSIPAELETITLKCLAKEPGERYATAGEMAEDLRRWLCDHAIKAKPPGWREKAAKWGRRHPGMTTGFGLALGLFLAGGWAWHRESMIADNSAKKVAFEADELRVTDRLSESLQAARRAADLLPRYGGDSTLRGEIEKQIRDIELLNRLEEIRLEQAEALNDETKPNWAVSAPLFQRAFELFGVDVLNGDESTVRKELSSTRIVSHVSAALCEWARITPDLVHRERLSRLAIALDSDPRQLVAQTARALRDRDVVIMKQLTRDASLDLPRPPVVEFIGGVLLDLTAMEEAEQFLRVAQRKYPSDFWINHLLADALMTKGKARSLEAIACRRTALALRPKSPGVWLQLARTLQNAGSADEAVAVLRHVIDMRPDYSSAHNSLGILLYHRNQLSEAESCYRRAIATKSHPQYHANLSMVLLKQDKVADAEVESRRAMELYPKSAEALVGYANVLTKQKHYPRAEAVFRQAISLNADNYQSHNGLGCLLCDFLNKPSEAETEFRKAIQRAPGKASYHTNLGNALKKQRKFHEAETAYRKAVELDPTYESAHYGLGQVMWPQGRFQDAESAFRKAIEINPNDPRYHTDLGAALGSQRRNEEAAVAFADCIKLEPRNANAHRMLGMALQRQSRYREAENAFRRACELRPDDVQPLNSLARFLAASPNAETHDPAQAIRLSQKAISKAPNDGEVHHTLGVAHYRSGNWTESVSALNKSIKLQKGADSFHSFFLAMAHHQLGERDKAANYFSQAIEWMEKNKPNDPELLRFRKEAVELLRITDEPKSKIDLPLEKRP